MTRTTGWQLRHLAGAAPTGQQCVPRVMRDAGLVAPLRTGRARGLDTHKGPLILDRPAELWRADMTTLLREQGTASIYTVADRCTAERLRFYAVRHGIRLTALQPLRKPAQDVARTLGETSVDVVGLSARHTRGSRFIAGVRPRELRPLTLRSSSTFAGQPEAGSCTETIVRSPLEQMVSPCARGTTDELNEALQESRHCYYDALLTRHPGQQSFAHQCTLPSVSPEASA